MTDPYEELCFYLDKIREQEKEELHFYLKQKEQQQKKMAEAATTAAKTAIAAAETIIFKALTEYLKLTHEFTLSTGLNCDKTNKCLYLWSHYRRTNECHGIFFLNEVLKKNDD